MKVKDHKKLYKKKHPEKGRAVAKRWSSKMRVEALVHYSGGIPHCANCGESNIEFLEIDHINGGGKKHKREIHRNLYRWLKDNQYPDGFQILCSNCNTKRVKVAARTRGETGTPNQRRWYRKNTNRKMVVFSHYLTGGEMKCSCCGEKDFDVLCIDHIAGDGAKHRTVIGNTIYLWLKRNNYPPGFRILCHNCNQSLGTRGCCPHHPQQHISQVDQVLQNRAGPEPAS